MLLQTFAYKSSGVIYAYENSINYFPNNGMFNIQFKKQSDENRTAIFSKKKRNKKLLRFFY